MPTRSEVIQSLSPELDQDLRVRIDINSTDIIQEISKLISEMRRNGMDDAQIGRALKEQLSEGGRLYGLLHSRVKSTNTGMIGSASGRGQEYVRGRKWSMTTQVQWVINSQQSCKSCLARYGLIKPYGEWIKRGLPRSGFSICFIYCKCDLVEVGQTKILDLELKGN